jgi:SAM-dependent methyltransferase
MNKEAKDIAASGPADYSRYLRAKKSVDDRSLNLWVYQKLTEALADGNFEMPLNILEIGCGIGTMIERLWDWGLVPRATYTALDRERKFLDEARGRLKEFARSRTLLFWEMAGTIRLQGESREWLITLKNIDWKIFCKKQAGHCSWDLLLAHAFMDLIDLPTGVPRLLSLLRPGALYYFTLAYDGGTIFSPDLDRDFEDLIINLYHQSMDGREGGTGGHSQTGRRLLEALNRHGSEILAAGSSNWLVWPKRGGSYSADEIFFLHCILDTIHQALADRGDLDQERFQYWLSRRRQQIETGELIYMAQQLDVNGRR